MKRDASSLREHFIWLIAQRDRVTRGDMIHASIHEKNRNPLAPWPKENAHDLHIDRLTPDGNGRPTTNY
ncbi:MAG: hypothetical protein DMG05_25510 [Acidobacteria bacterium]|nr:MAG: hypothetical protein DMG05_25510 [Acidobacteriota bacterium]